MRKIEIKSRKRKERENIVRKVESDSIVRKFIAKVVIEVDYKKRRCKVE